MNKTKVDVVNVSLMNLNSAVNFLELTCDGITGGKKDYYGSFAAITDETVTELIDSLPSRIDYVTTKLKTLNNELTETFVSYQGTDKIGASK